MAEVDFWDMGGVLLEGNVYALMMSVIAFWYSILSMLTDMLDHSRLFAFT